MCERFCTLSTDVWYVANGWLYSYHFVDQNVGVSELPADTDNDGLPDSWELEHSGGITNMVPSAHNDSDGFTNLEEWIAYTDPTDELSFFFHDRADGERRHHQLCDSLAERLQPGI